MEYGGGPDLPLNLTFRMFYDSEIIGLSGKLLSRLPTLNGIELGKLREAMLSLPKVSSLKLLELLIILARF
jgi:hypothetical protein